MLKDYKEKRKRLSLKRGLSLFLIINILLLLCGCSANSIPKQNQKAAKDIIEYLNNRYTDDAFSFIEFYDNRNENFQNTKDFALKQCRCRSEKYPDYPVTVTYIVTSNHFFDNYLDIKYSKRANALINKSLTNNMGSFDFCFIPFQVTGHEKDANEFQSDITFREYMANGIFTNKN